MNPSTPKPNILFITTDQQRRDTLGCYGNPYIKTPHLDKLASQGTRFTQAYCESPVCLPCRNTMITGKSARNHGVTVHNASLRNDEQTLGHVLQEHGYTTHFIGKPHFKSQQHSGTEESIADWREGKMEGWDGPYVGFQTVDMILGHSNPLVGHYGTWIKTTHPASIKAFMYETMESLHVTSGQGVYKNAIPEAAYSSTYVGNQTCSFLERMKNQPHPFYCFVSFPDPHWPINPPSPYFEMYDSTPIPQQTPYHNEDKQDNYPAVFRKMRNHQTTGYDGGGHYMKNTDDTAIITRPYWGAISLIDKNVGRILNTLEQLQLTDNTIVIFTTDHGEYMGAHGMMAKGGVLWQEYIQLPLIVSYPGIIPSGTQSDSLFSFIDFVPTLLEGLGIQNAELAYDGISQWDVWKQPSMHKRTHAIIQHPNHALERDSNELPDQYAIIDGTWKLVYFAGDAQGLLFHLKEDPKELNNLYNHHPYKTIQQQLIDQLLDELIFLKPKEPLLYSRKRDSYGTHEMKYQTWKKELDHWIN